MAVGVYAFVTCSVWGCGTTLTIKNETDPQAARLAAAKLGWQFDIGDVCPDPKHQEPQGFRLALASVAAS